MTVTSFAPRTHGPNIVRSVLSILLVTATACGKEGVAPPSSDWATHTIVRGRVYAAGLATVPGALVFFSGVNGGDDSFAKFAADTVLSDGGGNYQFTIRRTNGAQGAPQPALYVTIRVTARQTGGAMVGESNVVAKFGPIGETAPVTSLNILPPP